MLYLQSSYSLWQAGLKFNEFPWERFANKVQLFQKITIWQKISLCYSSREERQRAHCFAGRFPPDISVWFFTVRNQLMDQRGVPPRGVSDRGQRGRKKGANECSGFLTS